MKGEGLVVIKPKSKRACRRCGCTYYTPCINQTTGDTCFWVSPDLCSSCLTVKEKKVLSLPMELAFVACGLEDAAKFVRKQIKHTKSIVDRFLKEAKP
jgi:hypothetical protein